MFKTRKRWISLLLTLAMLVAFCIPVAAPVGAASASGYEALQVPEIDTDDVYELGTVLCSVRAAFQGWRYHLSAPADDLSSCWAMLGQRCNDQ